MGAPRHGGQCLFAVVDAVTGSGSATGATAALSMLALVASLGGADWLQYRLRVVVLLAVSAVEFGRLSRHP